MKYWIIMKPLWIQKNKSMKEEKSDSRKKEQKHEKDCSSRSLCHKECRR